MQPISAQMGSLAPPGCAEGREHLCLHIFAGSEDVLHQLHIIEHQCQAQGFRVAIEFAEDAQGTAQESRVLGLRDIAYAALRRRQT